MDRHEQHHQHHQKEREEKKKHEKEHERELEKRAYPHPAWFFVLGVVLVGVAILIWTMLT
jgi:hypothetical protein